VICAFAYNFVNLWSGTSPFIFTWIIAYSYIVVVPSIFVAAFNRDISAKTAFKYPSIYVSGRANLHMGRPKIIEYVFKSVMHATIICALAFSAFALQTLSYLELGTMVYWCVILVVLLRLGVECYTWTIITIIIYVIAVIIFPILEYIVYGSDNDVNVLWGTTVLFGPKADFVWCVTFFIVVVAVLSDVALSYGRRMFFPNLIDVVIETDRGYAPDENSLKEATEGLNYLTRPQELPADAVSAAVGTADSIPLAPRYRSAYAQDIPEGQTVVGNKKSRFSLNSSFTFKRVSFTGKKSQLAAE